MKRRQNGIILLVAIVTAMALAFAGMALVRAVLTGVAIGGNLIARKHAMLIASAAVEHGVATLYGAGAIDTTIDAPEHNYFAARQAGEDQRGVPRALQSLADYPPGSTVIDAGDHFEVRHVIERLCLAAGAASVGNCTLSPPSVEAASGAPPPGEPARKPYYRVSIRVDGPAGAATLAQAVLSGAHPNPRLSWRMLDE
jgi:type IV pilus assembly protein PilX